jgi:hypothetical protein
MRRAARSLFIPLVYTTMVPKMKIELTTYALRVMGQVLVRAPHDFKDLG